MSSEVLNITGFSVEGAGIGRSESGRAVFVKGAIPGEKVQVDVKPDKKILKGDIKAILDAAECRCQSECPLFGKCGGCQLSHIKYPEQAKIKSIIVKDALRSIGGVDSEIKVTPAKDCWHYRNRGQFPAAEIDGRVRFGFYGEKSHEVIPVVGTCRLFDNKIMELLAAVEEFFSAYRPKTILNVLRHAAVRINSSSEELLLTLIIRNMDENFLKLIKNLGPELKEKIPQLVGVTLNVNAGHGNEVFGDKERLFWGKGTVTETFMGRQFFLSAQTFFQNNYLMAEELFKALISLLPEKAPLIIDAYAGMGVIGQLVSERAQKVISIEECKAAVNDGERFIKRNGLSDKHSFVLGKSEAALPELTIPDDSVLIVDPPRNGVHPALWETLRKCYIPQIAYVSCNPGSLARDLKILLDQGYKLTHLECFDLFPQTVHIETIAILTLSQGE